MIKGENTYKELDINKEIFEKKMRDEEQDMWKCKDIKERRKKDKYQNLQNFFSRFILYKSFCLALYHV